MVNLPTKESEIPITCIYRNAQELPSGLTIGWTVYADYGNDLDNKNLRYRICDISNTTPEATADDIAKVIREARDTGFQQGLESVKKALGINETH